MANNVVNKTVNIYIESGQAQKAFDALIKKEQQLKDELEKATNPKVVERLKNEIAALQEPIERARKKVAGELAPSFNDTKKAVDALGQRMKRMSEDDADFTAVVEQYRKGRQELDAQTEKVGVLKKAMNSFWQEAKTVAVGVLIGNTVQSMFETVMGYVTGMVTGSAKIADELSNIEKTTGLSTEEVKKLNSELTKIDTRTSSGGLREIAAGLGQIGEAATASNVAAIDKIVVALGDEFGGGAQQITTQLGVLRNNLQDIKTGNYGDDVLHIGNALNVLGAEGLATAPVVTDIANRIAGVGGTFGLTSGQILGTAATFQELGIEAERGSTAFVKIMQRMAAEPEKFASVAGKSVKEFTDLVNKDILSAFTQVAEGARSAGSSNAAFGKILKDLDADGSGAGEVLSKLAKNGELLAGKINVATDALRENNSITDEFNKLNNNAAGELEKLKKNFASLFSSSTVMEGGAAAVRMLNSLVNVLKSTFKFISDHKVLLGVLSAAYLLLTQTVEGSTLANIKNAVTTRAKIALAALERTAVAIQVAAQLAYAAVVDLVTKRITLAAAAQRIWAAVSALGAGPIGVLLVAVGALAIGIQSLFSSTQKLTAEQRVQAQVARTVAESVAETQSKMAILTGVLKDNTVSLDNRKKALAQLIAISPEYLKGLTLENINTDEGRKILDNYNKVLVKNAELKAKSALLDENAKTAAKALLDLQKEVGSPGTELEFAL